MSYEAGLASLQGAVRGELELPTTQTLAQRAGRAERAEWWRSLVGSLVCLVAAVVSGIDAGVGMVNAHHNTQWAYDILLPYAGAAAATAGLLLACAVAFWRRSTAASVFVRGVVLGAALMAFQFGGFHYGYYTFGIQRWLAGADLSKLIVPWWVLRNADVAAVVMFAAVLSLVGLGRRGLDYDGSSFAPVRFRRELLIAATGLFVAAAAGTVGLGFQLGRGIGLSDLGPLAGTVLTAITAWGILRLRVWAVGAALLQSILYSAISLWTDAPLYLTLPFLILVVALIPLTIALARAAWNSGLLSGDETT